MTPAGESRKRRRRLTEADWRLIREALNHAIEERDGFRDALTSMQGKVHPDDKATAERCDDFIRRAEAFSQKHFGKPSDFRISNDRLAAMPSVSIFELGKAPDDPSR